VPLANPNVTAKERLRVEQIYYQLVRDNPQSVPAQNALAAFLWKNGKRKQPSNICASRKGWSRRMGDYQLVRDHPQSVPAQNALAAFLWKNGKAEAAVEHWRTAQRLEPKNGEAANSLGGAYLRIGRVPEAAEQFLLAVRSENNNPDYHFDLGNVEFVLRRDLTAAWKIDSAELLQRAAFRIS